MKSGSGLILGLCSGGVLGLLAYVITGNITCLPIGVAVGFGLGFALGDNSKKGK